MIAHKGIERRASTPSEKLASDEARRYTRNLQIQDHTTDDEDHEGDDLLQIQDHTTDDEDHEVGDDLCQVHLGYVESNSESMSSLTGKEVWRCGSSWDLYLPPPLVGIKFSYSTHKLVFYSLKTLSFSTLA